MKTIAGLAAILTLTAVPAFAQGSDDCNTPDVIAGVGTFNFDNSAATMDGAPDGLCYFFGSSDVESDVWYEWTAPSTNPFTVSTCSGANGVDTKIAVYDNSAACGGSAALACNDDSCGLASSLQFSATSGQVYQIRLGTFPGASGGAGTFDITAAIPTNNDDCTMPVAIAGTGLFNFDNSFATTDGAPDSLCYAFGSSDIESDVWFEWTAPSDDAYIITTCGLTSVDTRLAVYDNSVACGGSAALACNDDDCGLQSTVTIFPSSGQTYQIRLGTFPGAAGGTGQLSIEPDIPIFNPSNGNHYRVIDAPGISWDMAKADAELTSYLGIQGRLATINDQAENDFIYSLGGVHYHFIGGFQDLGDPGYVEPDGGWKWITGEPFSYTNWLAGEPNDTGPNGAEDYLELLDNLSLGQTWNDTGVADHSGGYVIEYPTGESIGTNYCAANPNSTGNPAVISAEGSVIVADNNFDLFAVDLPPNKFGYFLASESSAFITNPGGSQGNLCIGSPLGRFQSQVQNSGPQGEIDATVDVNNVPLLGAILAGETWYFQAWYRDNNPTSTSNFSDGLEVPFQ